MVQSVGTYFIRPFRPRNLESLSARLILPFESADVYYGATTDPSKVPASSKIARTRTMSFFNMRSAVDSVYNDLWNEDDNRSTSSPLKRRASTDDTTGLARRFFIADIDLTLNQLLKTEDTDHNCQITIEDSGPKVLQLGTANSNGINKYDIRGTYMLSNLLQELTIAKRLGRNQMVLDERRLNENPVSRLCRLIKTTFWKNLTRQLDAENIAHMAHDTKIKGPEAENPRIYVPYDCAEQYEYFTEQASKDPEAKLEVVYLPKDITPEYVRSINHRPGLLALAMRKVDGKLTGYPYIVPGGRFNELYGWDSYMETIGLLVEEGLDETKIGLARGMVENFVFEITHYGKILNANRSYYLCRSQPPFLTDMANKVYNKLMDYGDIADAKDFLARAFRAAIKEYKTVWMAAPRLDFASGLSCYHPDGVGIPPETEASHFEALLAPYEKKHNVSFTEFQRMYNADEISEPELDEYFVHDRAVRESGHDTSYRLEGKCADLATIDLNTLLYKYEVDIAAYIDSHGGTFDASCDGECGHFETAAWWREQAELRKERINRLCWDEEAGIYHDYNIKTKTQNPYESATTYWALWAGVASPHQAELMVTKGLPKFEMLGGLAAGTEESRGLVGLDRPSRQWDYPFGWAPQQIMAWVGLTNYGYKATASRLAYRWLYLMTKAFVDYNGIVVEKYDVTSGKAPHKVEAEYGNQGSDFKGVATEGFGWVNTSYVFGVSFLDNHAERALGTCTPPHVFFGALRPEEKEKYYD
ncbi:glycoside hydrolase family 37 protein [Babjeviella inositovora NRRL Y-12698]|uniref:Trehalase n=1 Tax=Babjeviella inositovora NRRL Y-12698 TaxID=984486 RepID=A0A1E3QQN1_9ASCO|nr:glycoside hydrolase family 37 protein [Babjeviella inositovora NRRL Y-12698]ODQ79995.1 glycoside hydrolase family 37 protein [Babjeviella inositovora NRRL Y-12698]